MIDLGNRNPQRYSEDKIAETTYHNDLIQSTDSSAELVAETHLSYRKNQSHTLLLI